MLQEMGFLLFIDSIIFVGQENDGKESRQGFSLV